MGKEDEPHKNASRIAEKHANKIFNGIPGAQMVYCVVVIDVGDQRGLTIETRKVVSAGVSDIFVKHMIGALLGQAVDLGKAIGDINADTIKRFDGGNA